MAPLPPVPKTIQMQLIYTWGSNTNIRNLLYFTYTGSIGSSDLTSLCRSMKTQWTNHMASQTVGDCSLAEVFGNDLASSLGAQAIDGNPPVPGTNAGTRTTAGTAFVVSNETALKYRGGHSRTYIPGMPEANTTDSNSWSNTAQQAILSAWTAFISAFITTAVPAAVGTLQQVVAHRFGKTPNAPVLAADTDTPSVPLTNPFVTLVSGYRTNPQVASQRRRNQQGF
jgi:hypothetical protein